MKKKNILIHFFFLLMLIATFVACAATPQHESTRETTTTTAKPSIEQQTTTTTTHETGNSMTTEEEALVRANDRGHVFHSWSVQGAINPMPAAGKISEEGSAADRAIASQAVSESATLLKTSPNVLPIATTGTKVLLAGEGADDIGIQSGGWTITWQGSAGTITTASTATPAAAPAARRRVSRLTTQAARSTASAKKGASGGRTSAAHVIATTPGTKPSRPLRSQNAKPTTASAADGVSENARPA